MKKIAIIPIAALVLMASSTQLFPVVGHHGKKHHKKRHHKKRHHRRHPHRRHHHKKYEYTKALHTAPAAENIIKKSMIDPSSLHKAIADAKVVTTKAATDTLWRGLYLTRSFLYFHNAILPSADKNLKDKLDTIRKNIRTIRNELLNQYASGYNTAGDIKYMAPPISSASKITEHMLYAESLDTAMKFARVAVDNLSNLNSMGANLAYAYEEFIQAIIMNADIDLKEELLPLRETATQIYHTYMDNLGYKEYQPLR